MLRVFCFAGLAFSLSACAGGHPPLPEASGPYRPMNATRWKPTREDLSGPREPIAPADSPALAGSEARS